MYTEYPGADKTRLGHGGYEESELSYLARNRPSSRALGEEEVEVMRFDSAMNRPIRKAPVIRAVHDVTDDEQFDGSYIDNSAITNQQNAWLMMQQNQMERLDILETGDRGEES